MGRSLKMAGERELILKLGKKITDRIDVKLGMTKLDADSPEYYLSLIHI